jgi:hypothetical protein
MQKRAKRKTKKKQSGVPPSSYVTFHIISPRNKSILSTSLDEGKEKGKSLHNIEFSTTSLYMLLVDYIEVKAW